MLIKAHTAFAYTEDSKLVGYAWYCIVDNCNIYMDIFIVYENN